MTSDVYQRAPDRIERSIVVLTASLALIALTVWTWRQSAGVFLGGAATWLNFRWMRTSVVGLTNRLIADPVASGSTFLLGLRFLLRYAVIGAVVYATLKGSLVSGLGVLVGLLLVVPALLIEAGYELYLSRRPVPQVPSQANAPTSQDH